MTGKGVRCSIWPWQQATVSDLRAIVAGLPIDDVIVIGSTANERDRLDAWSDLDVVVVAETGTANEFWPDLSWLRGLGDVAAFSQSARPPGGTSRLLFTDGRRVDVIVTDTVAAPGRRAELAAFSSIADTDGAVGTADLDQIANDVLFDAALASVKAARGERLISTHLALGLLQRCLEAAMVVRDLSERTAQHSGPRRHDALADLLPDVPAAPRPDEVLHLIGRSLDCFAAIVAAAPSPPAFPRQAVDLLLARAGAR